MLKVIDLFAGAGGLSLGFLQSGGYEIVAAVENNKDARLTYKNNHDKDTILYEDVRDVDFFDMKEKFGEIDVIIGGPPCQGFSNANRQKNHIISLNNSLVKDYFKAVRELSPKAFVMENVKMLTSETHRFYDSYKDHEEVSNLGLNMAKSEILIGKKSMGEYDLQLLLEEGSMNKIEQELLPNNVFILLNTFIKKRDILKQRSFFEKNRLKLTNLITKCIGESSELNEEIGQSMANLFIMIKEKKFFYSKGMLDRITYLVRYQQSLRVLKEIEDNKIIKKFSTNESDEIIAEVQSYSVIDYINKILKNDYVQDGRIFNSLDFGVPQTRKRHIIIGVRSDVMKSEFTLDHFFRNKKIVNTVRDAILDLEEITTSYDMNSSAPIRTEIKGISEYAEKLRDNERIYNHINTKSTPIAIERFRKLKEGQNFHDLDESMKTTYYDSKRTQNTIYLRLKYDSPSGTVVNVRKSMWIHPILDRALSIREAARLQSFPDSFVFYGSKDSQYQQVGNAVPPMVAKEIGSCVKKIIGRQ
ncbi:DNA cytosine methyltransferase [Listeria grandensis]|uniref:Cytosine-specific methyltransferase n=1 Tax=Listeria grandensis TaxID=1494963 RepID=A0A7X0Y3S5_9LIST|nr:DNA cytosine methyltransferase [Listeria grandensis]MBC1936079.1 DNA cytosine methyltransferase [Listeria grandensis]MBC6316106.1 DNA cytosine methyltransferase [Listeria grandensis]